MLICKFCGKECANANSLRNHERLCKSNPDKQVSNISKYKQENPGSWNKGLVGVQTAWNKGLPGTFTGKKHTAEVKLEMSNRKKALYASGWEPTCGRCKKYLHSSPIAGDVKLDGTWEVKVAEHLDKLGVVWKRNRERFSYIRPDGKSATYQPDFYVEDWCTYLEVKGYETALDRAKWEQFDKPLIVWRKKEIQNLE